jgi:hypothetical protein
MTNLRTLLILSLLLAPASALAAPVQTPVKRLSDEQVEQVLAAAAAKREAAEAAAPDPALAIHGEVGVEVGTGGHRAAFGTAFVPLGDNASAIVSFVTATGPNYYGRRRR